MIKTTIAVYSLYLVTGGCSAPQPHSGPSTAVELSEPTPAGHLPVTHRLPVGWLGEETTSSMRLAQYRIGRDSESVCVVYWFGAGGGGDREANFERWEQQFEAGATIASEEIDVADGIRASLLDVRGTYIAAVTPGAVERNYEPEWAMLAAYLDVPGGPLFLRLVGPASEVVAQREAFVAWIESFRAADGPEARTAR